MNLVIFDLVYLACALAAIVLFIRNCGETNGGTYFNRWLVILSLTAFAFMGLFGKLAIVLPYRTVVWVFIIFFGIQAVVGFVKGFKNVWHGPVLMELILSLPSIALLLFFIM